MDRFGVRRHDAALVLVRKRGKSGVALRLPPHSKKERSRIGMECGDKAKGRGTVLALAWKPRQKRCRAALATALQSWTAAGSVWSAVKRPLAAAPF
jgi:hypothetical protein